MNDELKWQIEALAFGVALEKTVSGSAPKSKADFEALCETVAEEVKRVVDAIEDGKVPTVPTKPKRAPRKSAESSSGGGKRPAIAGDSLRVFLGHERSNASTLQEIADQFSVSKGVAKRAVEALPGVRSAPADNHSGKRGVPPTVYWLE
jgi:hypothetical protein